MPFCLQLEGHNLPSSGLVGLVVRRLPRERKVPGSNPACAGIFSRSSHTSDLKIGIPVATLPGAWRYRVSTGTGRPGVSILWLGEVERWICNFYLSVAARKTEQIRPWDTLACCWDFKQPTNKQTPQAFVQDLHHVPLHSELTSCFSYSQEHVGNKHTIELSVSECFLALWHIKH